MKRDWLSLSMLALMIIVFPGLSWYYLRKGADYRIAALKELKQDLGKIGSFSGQPANWKMITPDSLKGRITIVNIIKKDGQLAEKQTLTAKKLHEQFGERRDIIFLSLLEGADSLTAYNYYRAQKIKRFNTTYFVFAGDQQVKNNWLQTFSFGQKGDFTNTENPYYVYIDIDGTVRNFYDVNEEAQVKKLVEHTAMKVFDKKENPRLSRELEK
jgi:hypothetical protein